MDESNEQQLAGIHSYSDTDSEGNASMSLLKRKRSEQASTPSKDVPCAACLGRHRGHTCGRGGRRGRPKGSLNRRPAASYRVKANTGVEQRTCSVGRFASNLFGVYNEMCNVFQRYHPSSAISDQPFGLFLFWIEEYLRLIAGVSKDFGDFKGSYAALYGQYTDEMTISRAFYMVQTLSHSMLPSALTSELFHSLDFTISGTFEACDEANEVLSLIEVDSHQIAASRQQCTSCSKPSNCRTRGSPNHSSVPLGVVVHLRIIQHFRHYAERELHTHLMDMNGAYSEVDSAGLNSDSNGSIPKPLVSAGGEEAKVDEIPRGDVDDDKEEDGDRGVALLLLSMVRK